jgi:hypothetical protein
MNKKNEALKMAIISFEAIMKAGLEDTQAEILQCKKALEQPAWQGLTNDKIREIGENCLEKNNGLFNWIDFARAIEQALKDKNT